MSRGQAPREIESRSTPSPVELRSGGGSRRVGGYGAVSGKPSQNLGGFVEVSKTGHLPRPRGRGPVALWRDTSTGICWEPLPRRHFASPLIASAWITKWTYPTGPPVMMCWP